MSAVWSWSLSCFCIIRDWKGLAHWTVTNMCVCVIAKALQQGFGAFSRKETHVGTRPSFVLCCRLYCEYWERGSNIGLFLFLSYICLQPYSGCFYVTGCAVNRKSFHSSLIVLTCQCEDVLFFCFCGGRCILVERKFEYCDIFYGFCEKMTCKVSQRAILFWIRTSENGVNWSSTFLLLMEKPVNISYFSLVWESHINIKKS